MKHKCIVPLPMACMVSLPMAQEKRNNCIIAVNAMTDMYG